MVPIKWDDSMGVFSVGVEFLNEHGFFTYLAYFLLALILYYVFEYLLKEHAKRIKNETLRSALSVILSIVIVILLFMVTSPSAGDAAAFISVLILALAVIFFLAVLAMKLVGIDVLSFFQK